MRPILLDRFDVSAEYGTVVVTVTRERFGMRVSGDNGIVRQEVDYDTAELTEYDTADLARDVDWIVEEIGTCL